MVELKQKFRKSARFLLSGDTLVEVMFAVGIFGMVAVGAISLMNRGLKTAQTTLETTMAMNELNTQAEALRFIHDAYISEENLPNKDYSRVWQEIAESAYAYTDLDDDFYDAYNGSETSCEELYNSLPSRAFIVNPRRLSSSDVSEIVASEGGEGDDNRHLSSLILKRQTNASEGAALKLDTTATYPRLIYDLSPESLSDYDSLDASSLYSAEGIWVVAVAEAPETLTRTYTPEYFDFYIRTCWENLSNGTANTISTIIRLSNTLEVTIQGSGEEEIGGDDGEATCDSLGLATMQNWQYNSESTSLPVSLCDSRDNSVYDVDLLADGNIWMAENLSLDFSNLTENISATNTNNPSSAFVSESAAHPESLSSWCSDYNSSCTDQIIYNTQNLADGLTSYGVYYNWYTATAGQGTWGVTNASGDLCPAGWRLPNGGDDLESDNDFKTLNDALGGITNNDAHLLASPNNFLRSGKYMASSIDGRDETGWYWSARGYGENFAYSLIFNNTRVRPMTSYDDVYHSNGLAVRCIYAGTLDDGSCPADTICYDENGASGEQPDQSVSSNSDVVLSAANITRSGYGFAGWNTEADGTGTSYGPNQTIAVGDLSAEGLTLYANWVPADLSGTLQSFSTDRCSALPRGVPAAFRDTRDSNTYAVARLEDGRCWMIENLRTNPSRSTLTATNTNDPTSNFLSQASTLGTLCAENSAECLGQSLYTRLNVALGNGFYYNYYTATAGNGTADFAGTVGGDLCPSGWHLPTSGYTGEFGILTSALGIPQAPLDSTTTPTAASASLALTAFPNNFTLSGFRLTAGTISGFRSIGYLWSSNGFYSSSAGANYRNFLSLGSSLKVNYGTPGYYGFPARCIFGDSTQADTPESPKPYLIIFNPNGGTPTSNTVRIMYRDVTANLPGNPFSRSGYNFTGWNTAADGSGDAYSDRQAVSNLAEADDSITLYAQWESDGSTPPGPTPEDPQSCADLGIPTMQNWVNTSLVDTGDTTTLCDARDLSAYPVTKLADGNIWMAKNMRLDFNKLIEEISASNTDNPASGFTSNSVENRESAYMNAAWWGSGSQRCSGSPRYNTTNIGGTDCPSGDCDEYGMYYSVRAAFAGSTPVSDSSLCPAGWHIPTYQEFQALDSSQLSLGNFSLAGTLYGDVMNNIYNQGINGRGNSGQFWANSTDMAARVNKTYNSDSLYVGIGGGSYYCFGNAIRCILDEENNPTVQPDSGKYLILFMANDGSDTNNVQQVSVGKTVNLNPNTFTREGYTFTGWNTEPDGSGSSYADGAEVQDLAGKDEAIVLYAQWGAANCGTVPMMQNWTNTLNAVGQSTTLCDIRDGQRYTVAKLADGNVWMTRNLRLNPGSANITTENTNNPTIDFLSTRNTATHSWPSSDTMRREYVDQILYDTRNLGNFNTDYDGNIIDDYGVYYNYYTATAGNGGFDFENGNVAGDLCPSGWRLPTGSSGGDFENLAIALFPESNGRPGNNFDSVLLGAPNNFIYSKALSVAGSENYGGAFWSATANKSIYTMNAAVMSYNRVQGTDNIRAATFVVRQDGVTVRCIYQGSSGSSSNSAQYEIIFASNDGSTNHAVQLVNRDVATPLRANTFTRDGYTFAGWNTEPDGSGTSYANGQSVTNLAPADSAIVLYAQWEAYVPPKYYLVIFHANDGTSTHTVEQFQRDLAANLPENTFTREGYTFTGWNTKADGSGTSYADKAEITNLAPEDKAIDLYAQWDEIEPLAGTCNLYSPPAPKSCASGNICYNSNGANGTMADQPNYQSWGYNGMGLIYGQSIRLYATNYSCPGYGFRGWNTKSDGSGTWYGSTEPIKAKTLSGLNLYAIWLKSSGTIQNWGGCSSLAKGSSVALTDSRDDETYTVTKLPDGKCWTTENLRLDLSSAAKLTTANTHLQNTSFGNAAKNAAANPSSANRTGVQYYTKYIKRTAGDYTGPNREYTPAAYSYGVYYNLYTAVAGSTTYTTTTQCSNSTNGGYNCTVSTANGDICPAGWRLPTYGSRGDYANLNVALGGKRYAWEGDTDDVTTAIKWFQYPQNFLASGEYYPGSSTAQNFHGSGKYWSSRWSGSGSAASGVVMSVGRGISPAIGLTGNGDGVYTDYTDGAYMTPIRCVWTSGSSTSEPEPDPVSNYYLLVFMKNDGTGDHTVKIAERGVATNIISNSFTRDGYTFTGWNTEPDGSGTAYTEGQSVTNLAAADESFILYAQWERDSGCGSTPSMQNWVNYSLAMVGDSVTLCDSRDGSSYTVAKLADGKIYMTQNLRLNFSSLTQGVTADNTHNPTATFVTQANSNPVSNTSWAYNAFAYNAENLSKSGNSVYGTPYTELGVYYNLYTAYAGNLSSTLTPSTAAGDLCPAGWYLPSAGQFKILASALGINSTNAKSSLGIDILRSTPQNFYPSRDNFWSDWISSTYTWDGGSGTDSVNYPLQYSSQKILGTGEVIVAGNNPVSGGTEYSLRCMLNPANDRISSGRYLIVFNSNDGTGNENVKVAQRDVETTIISNPFTRDGYTFTGWNTEPDGSGTAYTEGQSVINLAEADESFVLYAQWTEAESQTFYLSFALNGGTYNGGTAVTSQSCTTYTSSCSLQIANFSPTRTDYVFQGWGLAATDLTATYQPARSITLTSNTTLYALWTRQQYLIIYNANDGSSSTNVQIANRGQLTALTTNLFARAGFVFTGWNTAADGSGTSYEDGASVTDLGAADSAVMLYAQWQRGSGDGSGLSTCESGGLALIQYWNDTLPYVNDSTRLCDIRDAEVYTVTKLVDGKVWMTENLRLDISTADITASNTNNP
ncbi:InlB B-repeat-containing protein, partial [Candidatus Saccharibacteria bacterium]|nr:InlB B-repeat-containing protein [Candidatus Saccharibacteria bacterium]